MQQQYPNAQIIAGQDRYQDYVKNFLDGTKGHKEGLTLHLHGTSFQFKYGRIVEYTEWGTEYLWGYR